MYFRILQKGVTKIFKTFKISATSRCKFRYLGLEVKQGKDEILINQHGYIKKLETVMIENSSDNRNLVKNEILVLRSLPGQIA